MHEKNPEAGIFSGVAQLLVFILLMWGCFIVQVFLPSLTLEIYGIQPRVKSGLVGILVSPFLHGSLRHIAVNTLPLITLGLLIALRFRTLWVLITAVIALLGGLGVWGLARPDSMHIGASGIAFGYLGFLLFGALLDFSIFSLMLAGIAGFLYGGMLYGMLPGDPHISWEGHLFGFLAGIITAWIVSKKTND